jgi:4-hydroxy-3-methylbut-2-en-1-yl diphosphate reductase
MNLSIEIDPESGFCYGVIRAVETAENNLKKGSLHSLGSIVHNNSELDRLKKKGLSIIGIEEMKQLKNTTVLIRAHGEPPETYKIAEKRGIKLVDCTCPVVLKLQENIRKTYSDIASKGGQIVIFGKNGHAEVNGLVGQVDGNAAIVDTHMTGQGYVEVVGLDKIDFSRPIHIFSQTTKDPREYDFLCSLIKEKQVKYSLEPKIHNSICRRVALRHNNLKSFAKTHSVILFVSGRESSNGKVLYDLCKSMNSRSHLIQDTNQIKKEWFRNGDNIGICGATSTPKWQLETVANYLQLLT